MRVDKKVVEQSNLNKDLNVLVVSIFIVEKVSNINVRIVIDGKIVNLRSFKVNDVVKHRKRFENVQVNIKLLPDFLKADGSSISVKNLSNKKMATLDNKKVLNFLADFKIDHLYDLVNEKLRSKLAKVANVVDSNMVVVKVENVVLKAATTLLSN